MRRCIETDTNPVKSRLRAIFSENIRRSAETKKLKMVAKKTKKDKKTTRVVSICTQRNIQKSAKSDSKVT